MFETKFLQATAERAVKTFVQTLLALLGTDAAGVLNVDILAAVEVAGAAALLSVLTSFASANVGKSGPSLAGETTSEPRVVVLPVPASAPVEKAAPKKAAKPAVKKTAPAKKVTDK